MSWIEQLPEDWAAHPDQARHRLGLVRILNACTSALVQARDESALQQAMCDAITREDDFALAWMGWAQHDERQSVQITASAGSALPYLHGMQLSWGDVPMGAGPSGRCLRERQTMVYNDVWLDERFKPWLARARAMGLQAVLAVPVVCSPAEVGVLCVYARQPAAFGADEIELFEALARHVLHGIEHLRTRADCERLQACCDAHDQQLALAHQQALAAMAALLAQRDPYTAGHQHDVAALAVRIGQELQLPPDQLEHLRLAGRVHDLGKILVPVEILCKPARLSEAEMALVRLHPGVGYSVLKAMNLPWPIADIVHQHHECMDGSGYPLGLHAPQIRLESRILAVADIVESIAADRPYRPALGLPAALDEIQRLRGSKLDSAVVDAALRVLADSREPPQALGQPLAPPAR